MGCRKVKLSCDTLNSGSALALLPVVCAGKRVLPIALLLWFVILTCKRLSYWGMYSLSLHLLFGFFVPIWIKSLDIIK